MLLGSNLKFLTKSRISSMTRPTEISFTVEGNTHLHHIFATLHTYQRLCVKIPRVGLYTIQCDKYLIFIGFIVCVTVSFALLSEIEFSKTCYCLTQYVECLVTI